MSTTTTATPKRSFMDGKKLWFILSIVFAVIAVVFVLLILRAVTATEPYYVLNKNISSRQEITPTDLTEITTSAGSAPNSLTPADVANGNVFARYDLKIGDVPSTSSAGALTPLNVGIPSNYVITSFKADPSTAAGGNIQRGDYVDLYVLQKGADTAASHMFLQHVLVLSATADLDSATTAASTEDNTDQTATTDTAPVSTTTVPFLFTVGVSQTDAAKIITAQDAQFGVYVALSSQDANSGKVSAVDVGAAASSILSGDASDSGIGTDSTFTESSAKATAAQKATTTEQQNIRTAAQRITGIVKAYVQLHDTYTEAALQAAVTNANYVVPSGLTATISLTTGNDYAVSVTNANKSYGYTYDSVSNTFIETNTAGQK